MVMEGKSSHFSLKRGGVGRARKHAAYVIGAERYASREDIAHVSSGNMPAWATADPLAFWSAADQYERANGRAYHEFEFAIPRELSREDAKKLIDGWIAVQLGDRHPWTYGMHSKLAEDGYPNIHCHLMFSDRIVDGVERLPELYFKRPASRYRDRKTGEMRDGDPAKGGAGKDRRWNDKQLVKNLRADWQEYANKFLVEHGHRPRLDVRSNAKRGLGDPEPKIGPEKRRGDRWREGRQQIVATLRQRRRTTRAEFHAVKRELNEARRDRARRRLASCHDSTWRGQRPYSKSPLAVMTAEQQAGRTVFRWAHGVAAGRAAIIDRGDRLSLSGRASEPKTRAMIELAKAKGWASLVLTGSDEFKRLAAREALRQGLKVANPELAAIVSQLQQEIDNHEQQNLHHHQCRTGGAAATPRRVFAAWNDRRADRPGLRASRHLGPQRMPALRDQGSSNGQREASDAVLLGALSGRGDGDHGLHGIPVRGGPMSCEQERQERLELAQRWLATTAPVNALEAAALRADPARLLARFDRSADARRWALIERQRAEGVPEPLLGFEIDRQESKPAAPFRGTVRHVGRRAWVEPQDRPGVVVPVSPTQPVRPGQQIAVRAIEGGVEIDVISERDNTPRP